MGITIIFGFNSRYDYLLYINKLSSKEKDELIMIKITKQPVVTNKKKIGQIASFSIEAEGDIESYQWCLTEEKEGEMNIIYGATHRILPIKITKENANRSICCLVCGAINNEAMNVRSDFVPLIKQ